MRSIKRRFLAYIMPVQVVTLLVLGLAGYIFASKIVTDQSKAYFTKTIDVVFTGIGSQLGDRLAKIKEFTRSPSLIKFLSAPQYKGSFDTDTFNFQRGNGLILDEPEVGGLVNFPIGFMTNEGNKKVVSEGIFPSVELVNASGNMIAHVYDGGSNDSDFDVPDIKKLSRKDTEWFKRAMSGATYISAPQDMPIILREYDPVKIAIDEKVAMKKLIVIAEPIMASGKAIGVLMVTTTPDFLSVANTDDTRSTILLIVDAQGKVIASSGRTEKLDKLPQAAIEKILSKPEGNVIIFQDELAMSRKVDAPKWSIIVARDKGSIFSAVMVLRDHTIMIMLISMFVMAVGVVFIVGKLLMPIIKLKGATEKITSGELGVTVERTSDDELGLLTDAFNKMSTTIKGMHTELQEKNIRLENVGYVRKQMLKMMSHELKTPLTGIVGFYDLIEDQMKSGEFESPASIKETRELLEHMGVTIRDFHRLIMRLTKAASLVTSEVTKEDEITAVADVVGTISLVTGKLEKICKERNIEIRRNIPSECIVRCPQDMLALLFDEALSNSMKCSADGGKIEIDVRASADTATIDIRDWGRGIPQKYLAEVVEPFFEVADALHHSTGRYKAMAGGLGLGLTIIINIVKKYGGTIEITSEEGKGTALHITFAIASEMSS